MSYTVGVTGPITLADFREFIDPGQWRDDLPKGQGGTPVNLLCRELLNRGRKLVVLSCDSSVKDEIVLRGNNLRLCVGPKGVRPARNFFRTERNYLSQAIAREKPDVIHAHWTYEYAMPVQRSGIPHLVTAHDAPLRCLWFNFIPYRVARTLMAYRVLSRAKRVVSVSPYVARHLRRYMFYRGPEEVIPNGLPPVSVSSARRAASGEKVVFASVLPGWNELKNGATLLRAFAELDGGRSGHRLMMFGAGFGRGESAHQWAVAEGVASGVEFVGHLPHQALLERLANDVDVLVHPSLEEAQPMAVIEAMSLRIPVIGGRDSGGVPWTLDGGRAGLLVDVSKPREIALAMRTLVDDPLLRENLGGLGADLVRKRYQIDAVADAYERIYEGLLR